MASTTGDSVASAPNQSATASCRPLRKASGLSSSTATALSGGGRPSIRAKNGAADRQPTASRPLVTRFVDSAGCWS